METYFLYPSLDDVTLIFEERNWIMFYRHIEVLTNWIKNKRTHSSY